MAGRASRLARLAIVEDIVKDRASAITFEGRCVGCGAPMTYEAEALSSGAPFFEPVARWVDVTRT